MIIATYNVEFLFNEGEHQHSGQTWTYKPEYVAERVSKLAEKLKQINADILLLQEVGSESVVHKVIEQSGLGYQAFFGETDRFGVGNAVLYRVPTTEVGSLPTTGTLPAFGSETDHLSPSIPSRRSFVHLRVDYKGAPLHIFGLHIKANFLTNSSGEGITGPLDSQAEAADGLIRSELFRFAQAKKLRATIDDIFRADSAARVIIAGDFNAGEKDTARRIVQGVQIDRTDALFSATAALEPAKRFTAVSRSGEPYQIDDILCSPSLKQHIAHVSILNEGIAYHKNTPPYPEFTDSDHAPIVLALS